MQVIVFTGGGTGGHVYPGLAVLQALRSSLGQAPVRLVWIGSKDGIERGIVTGLGLEYHAVPTGKLRRYWSWKNVADAFRIVAGYLASRVLLRRLAPVFVFSKGGFVSVPPVRAAASLGIPVYSHESDFDPGLATRLNLRASRLVFCAYAESVAQFPPAARPRLVVSGNPVRTEVSGGDPAWLRVWAGLPAGLPVVLVLGGSLGARQVNELISAALPRLEGRAFVVHQTGRDWQAGPDTPSYRARPYFGPELADLYAGADLIVGRAGAGTLWEAAAAAVPLLLIPLGAGSRGDQQRNAALFAARGAASVLPDGATPADLADQILAWLNDPQRRAKAREALAGFGAGAAAGTIATRLLEAHPDLARV